MTIKELKDLLDGMDDNAEVIVSDGCYYYPKKHDVIVEKDSITIRLMDDGMSY